MALDPDLRELMVHTVTITPMTKGVQGAETWEAGDQYTSIAFIEGTPRYLPKGRENTLTEHRLVVIPVPDSSETNPNVGAKVVLPAAFDPNELKVVTVAPVSDNVGLSHFELMCGN